MMGSKTSRKARRNRSTAVDVQRPFDVRQHLARRLCLPAVDSLAAVVQREPGSQHLELTAEVLQSCADGLLRGVFKPADGPAFLESVQGIVAAVCSDEPPTRIQKTVAMIIASLSQEPILEGDPGFVDRVDLAVRTAALADRLPAETAAELVAVREALGLVEAGDDEGAAARLIGISFRSPLAAWRVLIRGMSSFYAGDIDAAIDAWNRLPIDRVPRGVANSMLATVERKLELGSAIDKRHVASLINKDGISDAKIIDEFRAWFADDEREEIAEQMQLMATWKSVDPAWLAAMRDRLYAELLVQSDIEDARRLTRRMTPPPWDPKLALPIAIAKMLSSKESSGAKMIVDVDKYLASLEKNDQLSESDRQAVYAVVSYHVADLLSQLLIPLSEGVAPSEDQEAERQRFGSEIGRPFADFIHRCVQRWPKWPRPMELLNQGISREFLPKDLLTSIHEQRMQADGENVDVLKAAANYYLQSEQFERGFELAEKLLRLSPRDTGVRELAWTIGRRLTQIHAIAGRLAQAKQMLEWTTPHLSVELDPVIASLFRATVHFKCGEDDAAQLQLLAIDRSRTPRVVAIMLMEIYAAKFKLSAKVKKQFSTERKLLLKKPSIGDVEALIQTCGPAVLNPYDKYSGAVTHKKDLIACCKQMLTTITTKYWSVELANVIGEFALNANDGSLRRKFIQSLGSSRPDYHIYSLLRAVEQGPQHTHYLLQDVVNADMDDPDALPERLRQYAKQLYERSSASPMFGFDDDFDEDDIDFSGMADDFDMDAVGDDEMDLLLRSMPAELQSLYVTAPKEFEILIKKLLPASVVKVVLKVLKAKLGSS